MKRRLRSLPWLRYVTLTLLFCVLLPAAPAHTAEREDRAGVAELSAPITAYKLVEGLRGTTRQAERVAEAVASFKINLCLLTGEHVDGEYMAKGGQGSPTAFAYGDTLYLRADSPTLLADLVHEGTHALDYLAGFPKNKRLMELRAYYYDREFQKATNMPLQFDTLLDVLVFVFVTM